MEIQEEDLLKVSLQTNRAPLVLAFAVTLLKYTMPEQPLSSRLSLAQAVVSVNSQSKARSIGLESGKSAEDEGWDKGQPKVNVMGREIAVMRRVGYGRSVAMKEEDSEKKFGNEEHPQEEQLAFWGLDLEALRKSNGPLVAGKNVNGHAGLPIYSGQAAMNYLLRSFVVVEPEDTSDLKQAKVKTEGSPTKKKPTAAQMAAKKEEAAAMLLRALNMLYESWATVLQKDELDRRAWSWYLHVRPDVEQGQAGWGQKGQVRLEDVLKLRRTT